jgi:branched-chain amino acid transport system substrate-binding protein
VLVVAGYVDQGGSGIIRAALDSGAFDTFHFPDGMIGQALQNNFGAEINGSFGQHPGTDSEGAAPSRRSSATRPTATSPFSPKPMTPPR